MSISGSSTRSSSTTQSDGGDGREREQPEDRRRRPAPAPPSESASRNVTRTTDIRTAPGTSIRAVERTGDSGTNRCTRTIAIATPIAPTTKSQRQLTLSTITPESTSPRPPPTPKTADSSPIPTFIRSGGNSSRMIPKLSGKTAPAAPETIRKAISVQMSGAAAQPMQPIRNRPSETTSSRSFPKRSPSLPRIGVSTAAERRKPVITHVTQVVVVSELPLELRERGNDHRLLQRVRGRCEREDAERQAVVLPRRFHFVT